MEKIFIIGDSFCTERLNEKNDLIFWVNELKKKLPNVEIMCDGDPSRDVQTIIDNWIKILPLLSDSDYVIICLPYFRRTRLPLSEKNYRVFKNDHKTFYTNRFVGTSSYNNENDDLEIWENNFNWKTFEKLLETQEMINSTNASIKNYIEIIESLIKISKGRKYIFSWDNMDIKSEYIDDKNTIKDKIGLWETYGDVYIETNGLNGYDRDFHWSDKMNLEFSKFIIKLINNE
jgi:hypothetical protein